MKQKLEMLLDELLFLKQQGVTSVYLEDTTLETLKSMVASFSQSFPLDSSVSSTKITSIPLPAPLSTPTPLPTPTPIPTQLEQPQIALPAGDKQTQWHYLRDKVLNCPICNSHIKDGTKVVFGVGNLDADIFFCGEAPGADEEIQGEPFVGKAGQLLTKIIQAMGLQRENVYIGNIMNWRPEVPTLFGNRPPTQEEMNYCLPYLKAQVSIVKPKVIVALGATAVNGLLGIDHKRRMGDIRGKWFEFQNVPLMITFHPSYLLRNDTLHAKRQVWEDILKVMEHLNVPISDKQRAFFK